MKKKKAQAKKKVPLKASKKASAKARKKVPAKVSKKAPAKAGKKAPVKAGKKASAKKAIVKAGDNSVVKFDPLQRYLSEISQYSLLTRDQERELGAKVKDHQDPDAAYVLITSNLRLVVKIALEYQRVWMQNLLDLIQEGTLV